MDFRVRDLMIQVLPETGKVAFADDCDNFTCGCTCSCYTTCSKCTNCSAYTPPPSKEIKMQKDQEELDLLTYELRVAMAQLTRNSPAVSESGCL